MVDFVADKLAAAFLKHVDTYGGLDICINSAGIATPISFFKDQTDGYKSWRRAIDINLVAVIESTRLAVWVIFFNFSASDDQSCYSCT